MSPLKKPLLHELSMVCAPDSLARNLSHRPGLIFLRSGYFNPSGTRYSLVTARPFLVLQARGARCELRETNRSHVVYGNPWHFLETLLARFEIMDEVDLPFPLGGCFGYWGYDLKQFVEPHLPRQAVNDLELPDCHLGFHSSLVVFDHLLGKIWIISTGMTADGSRDSDLACKEAEQWRSELDKAAKSDPASRRLTRGSATGLGAPVMGESLNRSEFIHRVECAREYIRQGDIYQVNLSRRLEVPNRGSAWEFFEHLSDRSPAPFAGYLHGGDFQVLSSSPELFLRMNGNHVRTQPIKGTRPRGTDPQQDARLSYELQTSPKETAELIMITDLLRNDLGRICEFGSVVVPELLKLERYPQVHHLVSSVEGRLREQVSHGMALAKCFPGGSITGAPKIRAMEIIDELEPVSRGPYTGCLGYLGFNQESQVSILIRTAICRPGKIYFHVGSGIVYDSCAEQEFDETNDKAQGFLAACESMALTQHGTRVTH